jgi:hypothetical protein
MTLGVFGGLFFYHRDEQQFLEEYRRRGIDVSYIDIGDAGAFYLFVGIGIGLIFGLALGISVYVLLKQRGEEEQYSILKPKKRQSSSATH